MSKKVSVALGVPLSVYIYARIAFYSFYAKAAFYSFQEIVNKVTEVYKHIFL